MHGEERCSQAETPKFIAVLFAGRHSSLGDFGQNLDTNATECPSDGQSEMPLLGHSGLALAGVGDATGVFAVTDFHASTR